MATTPRGTRSGVTGSDERDTLNPMQEPLGSMDRPGPRTSDINEVNLPPGETVRRTGNLGTTNTPGTSSTTSRNGRGFGSTFVIAAAVLVVAFLIALYLGSNRSNVATVPSAQPPVAETTPNGTTGDQTGSTTAPSQQEAPAPQQSAPGTGDAGGTGTGTGGSTTAPANP